MASSFSADLKAGHAGEIVVANCLKKHYGAKSFTRKGSDKTFDFVLTDKNGGTITYEVKTDFRAEKTGNLFFEYRCNKKDSGLTATLAFRWAILIPHLNSVLEFCPKDMWKYLQESKHKNVNGGDGMRVSGYVVVITDVLKLAFVTQIPLTGRVKAGKVFKCQKSVGTPRKRQIQTRHAP